MGSSRVQPFIFASKLQKTKNASSVSTSIILLQCENFLVFVLNVTLGLEENRIPSRHKFQAAEMMRQQ